MILAIEATWVEMKRHGFITSGFGRIDEAGERMRMPLRRFEMPSGHTTRSAHDGRLVVEPSFFVGLAWAAAFSLLFWIVLAALIWL